MRWALLSLTLWVTFPAQAQRVLPQLDTLVVLDASDDALARRMIAEARAAHEEERPFDQDAWLALQALVPDMLHTRNQWVIESWYGERDTLYAHPWAHLVDGKTGYLALGIRGTVKGWDRYYDERLAILTAGSSGASLTFVPARTQSPWEDHLTVEHDDSAEVKEFKAAHFAVIGDHPALILDIINRGDHPCCDGVDEAEVTQRNYYVLERNRWHQALSVILSHSHFDGGLRLPGEVYINETTTAEVEELSEDGSIGTILVRSTTEKEIFRIGDRKEAEITRDRNESVREYHWDAVSHRFKEQKQVVD